MKSLTDLAGDLNVSTEQVLTALRIVATRAGVTELADWAAKELEGYDADDELPRHRLWRLSITASMYNPMQAYVSNVHVGDSAIAEKLREKATTHKCRNGIGQIEELLADHKAGEPLAVEHPNLAQLVNSGPIKRRGWNCTQASATFSSVHLRNVVNRARQTALRLCLECEAKGIDLRFETGNDTTRGERKAWRDLLKEEGTKVTLRAAWDIARDYFAGSTAG